MRAAVAEAEHGARMVHHPADVPVVEPAVVHEGEEDQLPPFALQHPVQHQFAGIAAVALRLGQHRTLGRGLVVGRVAEREHLVEAAGHVLHQPAAVVAALAEQPCAEIGPAEDRDPLRQRQMRDLPIGGHGGEGVQRGGEAEHQPDRPRRHLRVQRHAIGRGLLQVAEHARPLVRAFVALDHGEPAAPVRALRHAAQQAEFVSLLVEVGNPADGAPPDRADRVGQPQQFALLGEGAGHAVAVGGQMRDGTRGGEAARARLQRLADDIGHEADIVLRRRLVGDAAFAHRIGPDGAMRHLCGDVDGARARLQRVEIFRKALPVPGEALGERGARNVLHALHHADQRMVRVRAGGREADAAIAHHHRGDAVPARRGQLAVPCRLAVIMGVDIDEAGRHQRAVRVDLAPAGPGPAAGLRDAPALDRNVAGEGFAPGSVDDRAAANDQIVHGAAPQL